MTDTFTEEELQVLADFHMKGYFLPYFENPTWSYKSVTFRIDLKAKGPFSYHAGKYLWKLNTNNPQIKELVNALDLL